jgi:hypothetical protein
MRIHKVFPPTPQSGGAKGKFGKRFGDDTAGQGIGQRFPVSVCRYNVYKIFSVSFFLGEAIIASFRIENECIFFVMSSSVSYLPGH